MKVIKEDNQFQLFDEENKIGKLDFIVEEEYIDALFIGVNEDYRGTEAKDHLLNALVALADELDTKVHCTCGFMRKWFSRNLPELLENDFR